MVMGRACQHLHAKDMVHFSLLPNLFVHVLYYTETCLATS